MAPRTRKTRQAADADVPSVAMQEEDGNSEREEQLDVLKEEEDSQSAESSLDQDDPPTPRKKRMRRNPSKPKAPRKKYVRGKQGGLEGLMKMPIEIFTEITSYLLPGDLLALTRSNKFFRSILLQRSAIQMWRRAESSVPELPPCPPEMCEPQYAALVFSKHCTLCGAAATTKPDTALLVRLCPSCRATRLTEVDNQDAHYDLVCHSLSSKPKTSQNWSMFSLTHEIAEVQEKKREFLQIGDKRGLAEWTKQRRKHVIMRNRLGIGLYVYFAEVEKSRGEVLREVKQGRREEIRERLLALGWTARDMVFFSEYVKPWNALVDTPRPLTDRIWNNLLPKLTTLLQENRDRYMAFDAIKQRVECRRRLHEALTEMRRTAHPFESILTALGVDLSSLPIHDDTTSSEHSDEFRFAKRCHGIENPFPQTRTILRWECLEDIARGEITREEVQAEFAERRSQVEEKVLEWRSGVERQLAEKAEIGSDEHEADVVVTVNGSTDSTAHLSRDVRLLLRADTIFKVNDIEYARKLQARDHSWRKPQDKSGLYHYPGMVTRFCCFFLETAPMYPGAYTDPTVDSTTDYEEKLDKYERHTEAERVVKVLLRDMGMPDVAQIQLQLMQVRFLCGRCCDRKPKSWNQMVVHYLQMIKQWETEEKITGWPDTRHPIVFRDVHDLESTDNPKPLIRILTKAEATEMTKALSLSDSDLPVCYLCYQTERRKHRSSAEDMIIHLQDVHDVAEPVEGFYYGLSSSASPKDKWFKEWDAVRDAM